MEKFLNDQNIIFMNNKNELTKIKKINVEKEVW